MRIIGVINIQSSLFISSLSAIGLGILLSVVQVKTPEHFQETEFLPFEEKDDSFKSNPTLTGKREKEVQVFRILGSKRSNLLNELDKDLELTKAKDFGFVGIGSTWTLFPSRNNLRGNQSDLLFNNLNADWMGARFSTVNRIKFR